MEAIFAMTLLLSLKNALVFAKELALLCKTQSPML